MQEAIICVDRERKGIEQLEEFLVEAFGNDYVVETAEELKEALKIFQRLNKMNISTAVLITGFYSYEPNDINLIEQIHNIDVNTKIVLFPDKISLESLENTINSVNIFRLIKKNCKKEELIQVINDACYHFKKEKELEQLYEKLKESETEKKLLLESITEGMVFIDKEFNILWENEIIKQEFKSQYNKCYEKIFARSTPCYDCQIKQVYNGLISYSEEKKIENKSYKLVKYNPVQNNEGDILGILMSFTDITNRKHKEKMNLILFEVAKLVNNANDIIKLYKSIYEILEKELQVEYFCMAGKDFDNVYIEYMTGKDKLIGIKKIKRREQEYISALLNTLSKQTQEDKDNNYIIRDNNNKKEIVIGNQSKIMIVSFENINIPVDHLFTFIKALYEQLRMGISKIENIKKITYKANHDFLTGLYNREYFMKTIHNKVFRKRERSQDNNEYSIAVLDLNYFKEVNDSYGHVVGDEVLITISQRILKALRYGDIVARIGGDEFAILLQQSSKTEVTSILSRVQKRIAIPIQIDNINITIGSSIGLVYEIGKYSNGELALKAADIAMYEAKKDKTGFGTFRFFEKDIEERLEHILKMEKSLENASKNKEFSMRYQPILSIHTNEIVGFEALIRWESNKGTFYNPTEFLPIAEENGQIEDIGVFVLEQAAIAIKQFAKHNMYKDCFISINLSSKQLFSNQQIKYIENFGSNNNKIQIEVTEKTLLDDFDKATKTLERLQNMGIKIHLDDFGTGYSSLSYLNSSEIHAIKIDRTFINNLPENIKCVKIVKTILSVARELGMTVTAEGVENKEQLEFLMELGCNYVQGYYISLPLTLEELLKA